MSAKRAQIWVAFRPEAMVSFEVKLSVVPGRYFCGQMMADCWAEEDILMGSL